VTAAGLRNSASDLGPDLARPQVQPESNKKDRFEATSGSFPDWGGGIVFRGTRRNETGGKINIFTGGGLSRTVGKVRVLLP